MREERARTEKETLRDHTEQIKQLEAKAGSECAEMCFVARGPLEVGDPWARLCQ